MKRLRWNERKSAALRADSTRNYVGFEECAVAIEDGDILDDLPHPFLAHQRLFVLEIDDYAYVVPYVEDSDEIFLKTVFSSRKHTAIYLTVSQT